MRNDSRDRADARPCPLCGSPDTVRLCVKDGMEILRCRACTNGFLVPPSPEFKPEQIYKEGYHRRLEGSPGEHGYDDYYALENAFKVTFARRLDAILRAAGSLDGRPRLLEVGCGPGFFLELARERFEVCGVELGSEAVARARARGLEVREAKFEPGAFAPGFAVVAMYDVIEHLPDPVAAVREARRLLKPGGLLALTTGDLSSLAARLSGPRWHLFTVPEHLFYFTRAGLRELLEREGFTVLSVRYPAGHFTLDYLFERLTKSLGLGRGYLRRDELRALLRRCTVPMNLFDVMSVLARRR